MCKNTTINNWGKNKIRICLTAKIIDSEEDKMRYKNAHRYDITHNVIEFGHTKTT